MYHTIKFDTHLQAYEIIKRRDGLQIVIQYEELLDYRVFHLHSPMQLRVTTKNVSKQYIYVKTDLSRVKLLIT